MSIKIKLSKITTITLSLSLILTPSVAFANGETIITDAGAQSNSGSAGVTTWAMGAEVVVVQLPGSGFTATQGDQAADYFLREATNQWLTTGSAPDSLKTAWESAKIAADYGYPAQMERMLAQIMPQPGSETFNTISSTFATATLNAAGGRDNVPALAMMIPMQFHYYQGGTNVDGQIATMNRSDALDAATFARLMREDPLFATMVHNGAILNNEDAFNYVTENERTTIAVIDIDALTEIERQEAEEEERRLAELEPEPEPEPEPTPTVCWDGTEAPTEDDCPPPPPPPTPEGPAWQEEILQNNRINSVTRPYSFTTMVEPNFASGAPGATVRNTTLTRFGELLNSYAGRRLDMIDLTSAINLALIRDRNYNPVGANEVNIGEPNQLLLRDGGVLDVVEYTQSATLTTTVQVNRHIRRDWRTPVWAEPVFHGTIRHVQNQEVQLDGHYSVSCDGRIVNSNTTNPGAISCPNRTGERWVPDPLCTVPGPLNNNNCSKIESFSEPVTPVRTHLREVRTLAGPAICGPSFTQSGWVRTGGDHPDRKQCWESASYCQGRGFGIIPTQWIQPASTGNGDRPNGCWEVDDRCSPTPATLENGGGTLTGNSVSGWSESAPLVNARATRHPAVQQSPAHGCWFIPAGDGSDIPRGHIPGESSTGSLAGGTVYVAELIDFGRRFRKFTDRDTTTNDLWSNSEISRGTFARQIQRVSPGGRTGPQSPVNVGARAFGQWTPWRELNRWENRLPATISLSAQDLTGFYQILGVHCNQPGFNRALSQAPGIGRIFQNNTYTGMAAGAALPSRNAYWGTGQGETGTRAFYTQICRRPIYDVSPPTAGLNDPADLTFNDDVMLCVNNPDFIPPLNRPGGMPSPTLLGSSNPVRNATSNALLGSPREPRLGADTEHTRLNDRFGATYFEDLYNSNDFTFFRTNHLSRIVVDTWYPWVVTVRPPLTQFEIRVHQEAVTNFDRWLPNQEHRDFGNFWGAYTKATNDTNLSTTQISPNYITPQAGTGAKKLENITTSLPGGYNTLLAGRMWATSPEYPEVFNIRYTYTMDIFQEWNYVAPNVVGFNQSDRGGNGAPAVPWPSPHPAWPSTGRPGAPASMTWGNWSNTAAGSRRNGSRAATYSDTIRVKDQLDRNITTDCLAAFPDATIPRHPNAPISQELWDRGVRGTIAYRLTAPRDGEYLKVPDWSRSTVTRPANNFDEMMNSEFSLIFHFLRSVGS